MINHPPIAVHAFLTRILTSLSVDEILLLRDGNLSTTIKGLSFNIEMSPTCLKHMNSLLFTERSISLAGWSRLYSRDSARMDVFARCACLHLCQTLSIKNELDFTLAHTTSNHLKKMYHLRWKPKNLGSTYTTAWWWQKFKSELKLFYIEKS